MAKIGQNVANPNQKKIQIIEPQGLNNTDTVIVIFYLFQWKIIFHQTVLNEIAPVYN